MVGQWKRKVQKLSGEMNDLKLLLEEQNSRNNLLEKKQRKFDSEIQLLQDELKKEKQSRDRLSREKEVVIAEKYTMESNVAVRAYIHKFYLFLNTIYCLMILIFSYVSREHLNFCFI